MRHLIRYRNAIVAGTFVVMLPLPVAAADDSDWQARRKRGSPKSKRARKPVTADQTPVKDDKNVPEINLLDAMRDGLVSVKAEGIGDGRMTMSVTNHTKRQLRVVLPPGIIAQRCHRPVRRHGWHGRRYGRRYGRWWYGRRHGRHGRRHGRRYGWWWHGRRHGWAWVVWAARPARCRPTMGMMMLARMIMYFCGDPDSWDHAQHDDRHDGRHDGRHGRRMMGGMGGGMMGGMGGGMRSVPPTASAVGAAQPGPDAAFADAIGEHHHA